MAEMEISRSQEPQFAAFVGMDWADQKHAWCLQAAGSTQRQSGELEHKVETVEAWVAQLCQRCGGKPIAVALEQTKGALVYMLAKYDCLHLFPVPSTMVASLRDALYPSGAKDDPRDADLVLDLLVQHRDKLRRLSPDSEASRRVQNLVEERRKLVDEKTAQIHRLTSYLKIYFPQMLDWFEDLDTELVCVLLARWPTLEELQKTTVEERRTFFHQHHCRNRELIERRVRGIGQAKPAIQDRPVIEAKVIVVKVLVQLIHNLREVIVELDGKIAEASAAHPDFFHLCVTASSGRCHGTTLVGGLRIATGAIWQRQRRAKVQWHRTRDRDEREEEVGTLPLGLPKIFAAEFSRMGGPFNRQIEMGPRLLPAATRTRPRSSRRRTSVGVQVDSHHIPLLARQGCL